MEKQEQNVQNTLKLAADKSGIAYKPVFTAWIREQYNGDLIPFATAETKTAATRRGRCRNYDGSDAIVVADIAISFQNVWYTPGRIYPETDTDKRVDADESRYQELLVKLADAGVTPEDVQLVMTRNKLNGNSTNS